MARLTASVVFPTPPLPEPTATIAPTPGRGCGDGGCWPGRGGRGVLMISIIRESTAALCTRQPALKRFIRIGRPGFGQLPNANCCFPHTAKYPPSTGNVAPVTHDDSSLAR